MNIIKVRYVCISCNKIHEDSVTLIPTEQNDEEIHYTNTFSKTCECGNELKFNLLKIRSKLVDNHEYNDYEEEEVVIVSIVEMKEYDWIDKKMKV